jgi:hypothetical protein
MDKDSYKMIDLRYNFIVGQKGLIFAGRNWDFPGQIGTGIFIQILKSPNIDQFQFQTLTVPSNF